MSGPKVVRVITREELIAAGERTLAQVDAAMEEWAERCIASGELVEGDRDKMQHRREQLGQMLQKEQFDQLTRAGNNEVTFLTTDAAAREQRAAEREALRLMTQLRQQEAAQSLLKALRERTDVCADLVTKLEELAAGQSLDMAAGLMHQACALVATPSDTGVKALTDSQLAMIERLTAGLEGSCYAAWKAAQQASKADPDAKRLLGIAELLATLKTLDATSVPNPLSGRLAQLQRAEHGPQRDLLLDSLYIDLQAVVKQRRMLQELRHQARALQAELARCCPQTSLQLQEAISLHLKSESVDALRKALGAGHDLLNQAQAQHAAATRRQAILQGLARLGYEVREDMATAWAKQGRLVIGRPDRPDYGVEVMATPNSDRMQVRAVAFAAAAEEARIPQQDIHAETAWCSEFGRLQEGLQQSGDKIIVEKAIGVGQVPLRVVAGDRKDHSSGAAGGSVAIHKSH